MAQSLILLNILLDRLNKGQSPLWDVPAVNHGSYIHQTHSPRRRISSLMPDDKKHPECASQSNQIM